MGDLEAFYSNYSSDPTQNRQTNCFSSSGIFSTDHNFVEEYGGKTLDHWQSASVYIAGTGLHRRSWICTSLATRFMSGDRAEWKSVRRANNVLRKKAMAYSGF